MKSKTDRTTSNFLLTTITLCLLLLPSCKDDPPNNTQVPQVTLTGPIVFITVGNLRAPQGIAVDAQGNVWVADTRNNMIRKFSVGAVQIDSLVVTQPSRIAIDKRTGDLLTVEGLTTVSRYLLQTKTLLASFPLNPFTGDGSAVFDVGSRSALQIRVEVRALGDLDSSPAGDIFVSAKGSPANCVIRILNGNVSALASSTIDSATTDARFVAVDVFGSVYTSFSFNRGPSSTTVLYAITPGNITQSHSLNEPLVSGDARGATTDGSGVLYITDPATQELVLVSTSTERTIRRYPIPDTNGFSMVPRDVTVASDGSVYVVVNDRLGTEAGAVLKYMRTTN